jgi:Ca2+-binding EF-hand superfamily protein
MSVGFRHKEFLSMKVAALFVLPLALLAQEGPPGGMSFIRMSPALNAVDGNQDGTLSAPEISGSPAQLQKLDKNGDGRLTRDEAGIQMQFGRGGRGRGEEEREEPPAPPPTADELTDTLMAFDANHNGKLEKGEVPERMQGLFERGDANHDDVLTRDEISRLADANRQQGGEGRGFGEGRGSGRRGFGQGRGRGPGAFDLAFNALDADNDGEISAAEIANAPAALKTLDRNGDGQITNDEVMPQFGGRAFGPGR